MRDINYRDGDVALTGKLALPPGPPRAAVLAFPNILNLTPVALHRTEMLAEHGYLAMLGDFYGAPVSDRDAAMDMGNALREDWNVYRGRINAAIAAIASLPERGDLPIAVIGYCLGGQAALEAARMNADIIAAVSFHGLLSTRMPAHEPVRPRILVCHGDADPLVPREQVTVFQEEMDRAGASWHLHSYGNVKHSFTDPDADSHGLPMIGYDASADRQSWAAMLSLFDELLG